MTRLRALMMLKVRGVRVVNIAAAACLTLIVLAVYWSKAGAGAEGYKIADATKQIAAEEQQVQYLRAERAKLTRPERLRQYAQVYLHMAPVAATHQATPEALLQLRQTPAAPASPTPVVTPGAAAPVEAAR